MRSRRIAPLTESSSASVAASNRSRSITFRSMAFQSGSLGCCETFLRVSVASAMGTTPSPGAVENSPRMSRAIILFAILAAILFLPGVLPALMVPTVVHPSASSPM